VVLNGEKFKNRSLARLSADFREIMRQRQQGAFGPVMILRKMNLKTNVGLTRHAL
jgi:hypothetical protein